ncbi:MULTISPECIES: HNH endonuclease signature motif containing protein [unclassified Pseudomonas]|uniref:HNH endonuclease signature motif containing protein n=1 Tax=unclassified Pseudomonas TaxID=196821 RepID=UPI0025E3F42B|nr:MULTISPECIES: HNH endonuclease signature motif containing protein [unclassified Pseudomonas]
MTIAQPIDLAQEELAEILEYEPDTGLLRWRPRPDEMFERKGFAASWNSRFAGRIAGNVFKKPSGHSYVQIGIGYRHLRAHRVIWLLVYGSIDDSMVIDHVNGVGTDNRLKNLRLVSSGDNSKNRSVSKRSRSGVAGVYWNSTEQKWHARIQVNGVRKSIGQYHSLEAAKAARAAHQLAQNYHPLHGLSREARAGSN